MFSAPAVSVSCWWSSKCVHLLFPFKELQEEEEQNHKTMCNFCCPLWFTSFIFTTSLLTQYYYLVSVMNHQLQLRGNCRFNFYLFFLQNTKQRQSCSPHHICLQMTFCGFSCHISSFPSSFPPIITISHFILGLH